MSVSLAATRALSCTGESSRRISSTAVGHSSGRAASVSRCSGRLEQHPNSVAQQVDRGLEARGQHQSRGRQQFLVAQRAAFGASEARMIWLIRSSPGLRRSSCRWSDSQSLKPSMPR